MLGPGDRTHAEATFAHAQRLGTGVRLPRLALREPVAAGPGPRCDGAYISYDGKAMPCCMVATPDRRHVGGMRCRAIYNGTF
jgi:hypothetical protein